MSSASPSIAAVLSPSSEEEEGTETSLRDKVLSVVQNAPNNTIRPAKLSQELGLSISDASAELCGLLQVCRPGSSSFRFETIDNTQTMVFCFPDDVGRQAAASQRKEDWKDRLRMAVIFSLKVLKVITAFGLIVSTVIVSIAGVAAMVAALVALSRGGGGGDHSRTARNQLLRRLQNLFVTLRQLLWCYAMFGPAGGSNGNDDDDPFLREAAYDTSLALSLCCGNPGSLWFWIRARRLQERRRRRRRGWARSGDSGFFDDNDDNLEGIRLIRRGSWGEEEEILPVRSATAPHEGTNKGLLLVAVEFLFGPTMPSGPSEADRWKLRHAVIVQKSTASRGGGISLQEFMPYADDPPSTLEGTPRVVSEGLLVVSYFNGQPVKSASSDDDDDDNYSQQKNSNINYNDPSKALFRFPELISESNTAIRYKQHDGRSSNSTVVDSDRSSTFDGFFFARDSTAEETSGDGHRENNLPEYLLEERKVFSRLTQKEFFHCLLVAVLNLVGVLWFDQSLTGPDGVLYIFLGGFGEAMKWGLVPILLFYAKLFFVIPSIRLCYLFAWNEFVRRRNLRRAYLASVLLADK